MIYIVDIFNLKIIYRHQYVTHPWVFLVGSVFYVLCCAFVLWLSSSGVLCVLCCQFLWNVNSWLPLRCSLTCTQFGIICCR